MTRLRLAATLVGFACLSSCSGEPALDQGTVVDKTHYEAHTEMVPVFNTICSGSSCGTSMTIEVIDYPEEFVLHLRDGDRTGSVDVGPTTWELFQKGMSYP